MMIKDLLRKTTCIYIVLVYVHALLVEGHANLQKEHVHVCTSEFCQWSIDSDINDLAMFFLLWLVFSW